jgi:hypothetical protein
MFVVVLLNFLETWIFGLLQGFQVTAGFQTLSCCKTVGHLFSGGRCVHVHLWQHVTPQVTLHVPHCRGCAQVSLSAVLALHCEAQQSYAGHASFGSCRLTAVVLAINLPRNIADAAPCCRLVAKHDAFSRVLCLAS